MSSCISEKMLNPTSRLAGSSRSARVRLSMGRAVMSLYPKEETARPRAGRRRGSSDRARSLNLRHQVVVPLAFDLEVGSGAQFDGLDEVVVDVGVDPRLQEGVE